MYQQQQQQHYYANEYAQQQHMYQQQHHHHIQYQQQQQQQHYEEQQQNSTTNGHQQHMQQPNTFDTTVFSEYGTAYPGNHAMPPQQQHQQPRVGVVDVGHEMYNGSSGSYGAGDTATVYDDLARLEEAGLLLQNSQGQS